MVKRMGRSQELTSEPARFESVISSKFHPPIPSALRPKPRPHKLERVSDSGTQQGVGEPTQPFQHQTTSCLIHLLANYFIILMIIKKVQ